MVLVCDLTVSLSVYKKYSRSPRSWVYKLIMKERAPCCADFESFHLKFVRPPQQNDRSHKSNDWKINVSSVRTTAFIYTSVLAVFIIGWRWLIVYLSFWKRKSQRIPAGSSNEPTKILSFYKLFAKNALRTGRVQPPRRLFACLFSWIMELIWT